MGSKLKGLQEWCKMNCEGYKNVSITNMTTSWRDGLAFCALIHKFHPELIVFDDLSKENIYENNKLAFETASKLGISPFLDPEDMVNMAIPDKLSIITYVSQYYNVFRKESKINEKDGSLKRIAENDKNGINEDSKKKHLESSSHFLNNVASDAKCMLCKKKVYLMERFMEDNLLYHRDCYRKKQRNNFQENENKNAEAFHIEKIAENFEISGVKKENQKSNLLNNISFENVENTSFQKIKEPNLNEFKVNQETESDLQNFKNILKEKAIKGHAPMPPVKKSDLTLPNNLPANSQVIESKGDLTLPNNLPANSQVIELKGSISEEKFEKKEINKASLNVQRSISLNIKNDSRQECDLHVFSTKNIPIEVDAKYNNNRIEKTNGVNCDIGIQSDSNQSSNNGKANVIDDSKFVNNIGEKEDKKPSIKIPEKPQRPFRSPLEPLSPKNITADNIPNEKPIVRKPNPIPKPRRATTLITSKELNLIDERQNKIEKITPNNIINKPLPTPRKIKNGLNIEIPDKSVNSNNKEKTIPRRPPPLNVVIHTPTDTNQGSLFQNTSQSSNKIALSPKYLKATPPPRPSAPPNLKGRKKIIPNIKFNFFDDINLDSNENLTDEMMLKKKMADQMLIIDSRLQQLEIEGKSLEVKIRECDITMEEIYLGQWFDLISKRNNLLREEADLIYSYKQHELENMQANIESRLRKLLALNDFEKSHQDKCEEQLLLNRLIDAVSKRSNIIDKMEEDRLRYLKEDEEIEKRKQTTINSNGLFQF